MSKMPMPPVTIKRKIDLPVGGATCSAEVQGTHAAIDAFMDVISGRAKEAVADRIKAAEAAQAARALLKSPDDLAPEYRSLHDEFGMFDAIADAQALGCSPVTLTKQFRFLRSHGVING